MNKIKFRLIPFIISLLIVISSVTGITLYSYYKYDNNKIRFVADYFHYEEYKSVETETQIEDFVKFTTANYSKISEGLNFIDAKSGNTYTNKPSDNSKNLVNGAIWENGVLHLPGYFDLAMYAETVYNTDSEEWILTYYIYLYNVNYDVVDSMDKLYFVFVDGIGESQENELYGVTKLDTMIKEIKDAEYGGPNGTNLPTYSFSGEQASSNPMYIHDNNAKGSAISDDNVPYVYRLTTMTEALSSTSDLDDEIETARWFYELKSTTFSIFHSGSDTLYNAIEKGTTDEIKELVRGTYVNPYEDAEDFNSKVDNATIFDGYEKNIFDAGYGKFIFWRIFIEGAITFVISGVLALLFYLIWQDDEIEEKKQTVKFKAPKPKKK